MQKVREGIKFDIGLAPQSLASTNATGEYFDFLDFREALAVMYVGPAAATKTAILAIQEAKDSSGTSAQALSGATVTHTANASSNIITATLVSVAANDTIVVNGLTFTAKTSADLSAREWDQSGSDTADAASLVAGINDVTYGVPGVTASNSSGVVTLKSDDGDLAITATETGTTITLADIDSQAAVDLSHFDLSDDYTHVACKVTTDATIVASVALLRGDSRGAITQQITVV